MEGDFGLLGRIIALQDHVVRDHAALFPELFRFICRCVDAIGNLDVPRNEWQSIPVEERLVFNYFQGDAVSSLMSAVRLCLHGCETDAYAVMRVAIETLTILEYVSAASLFEEANRELVERAAKGKSFSKRFSYATAVETLDKDPRERVRGHLSNVGCHPSPRRLVKSRYQSGDARRLKIGVAADPDSVERGLRQVAPLALFTVMVTDDFLWSRTNQATVALHDLREALVNDYSALCA